jgi:PAS domain S-box-containing protein
MSARQVAGDDPSARPEPPGPRPSATGPEALGIEVLARLMESSLDGIAVIDGDRKILYMNPAACEIVGYPREALLGQDVLMAFPPRAHRAVVEWFSTVRPGERGRDLDTLLRADGQERQVETAGMQFVVDGRPLVAAIFRDVTDERRRARETEALARIATSLTLDQSMEATLDALAAVVVEATGAVACTVARIDGDSLQLDLVTTHGLPPGYAAALEATWPAGEDSATVRALRSRRTVVVGDARSRLLAIPRYAPLHGYLRDAPWEALAVVPLIYGGRAIGVLHGYYLDHSGAGAAEIGLLRTIADQAAVVVENARLYAQAHQAAALQERQRLARELHDSVSQALYGIALGARTARTLLDRDPRQAAEPLEYVLNLAEAGLAEMRALIFELRPESLKTEGLVAALDKQLAALRARQGIAVEATLCDEPDVPLELKEPLYRIAREALHNIVKHARATHVKVRLECGDDGIALEVTDDGVGFDGDGAFPGHLGLRSMRERVEALGGTLDVASAPGRGTRIRARIPPRRPG